MYWLFFVSILITGFLYKKDVFSGTTFLWFVFIFLIIMQGFRHPTVGIDVGKTSGYMEFYNSVLKFNPLGTKVYNFERGFILYNYLLALISNNNPTFYLFITSFIIHIFIFIYIYQYSDDYLMSVIVYFGLDYFIFSFSGLRQSLALSFVVLAFLFFIKNQFFYFLIATLIAISFHKTASIFFLIYLLQKIKINKDYYISVVFILIALYLISPKLYVVIYPYLKGRMWYPIETGAYRNILFIGMLWGMSLINLHMSPQDDEVPFENLQSNMILIALLIQVFSRNSYVINRLGFYFLFPSIIVVPLFINRVCERIKLPKKLIKFIVYAFWIIVIYKKISSGYLNVSPYKLIF